MWVCMLERSFFFLRYFMEQNFGHHLATIHAMFFMALCDLSSDVLFMTAQPCQDIVAFCY